MLNLIVEIFVDLRRDPVNNKFFKDEDFRVSFITQTIFQSLAQTLKMNQNREIRPRKIENLYDVTPRAWSNVIEIPPLMLLNWDEVPQSIRFDGPKDPSLSDLKKVQEFTNWACRHLNLPRINVSFYHRDVLKLYLKFMQDPEKAKKALMFIFAHELGHIHYNHFHTALNHLYGALIAGFGITTYATRSLSIPFILRIPLICVAGIISSLALFKIGHSYSSRKAEQEADTFAAQNSSDRIEGGIYLFKVLLDHQKQLKKENFFYNIVFSSDGCNRLLYLSHPSEQFRIRNLENLKLDIERIVC